MKIIAIFILSFITLSGQFAESELKKLQEKFLSINNFSAEFEQISNSFGDQQNARGKFYYSKGNKFRIEFADQIICSDGKSIWNYDESEKRVVINNLDDQPGIFSIDKYIMEFSKFCNYSKIKNGLRFENCTDDNSFYKSIELSYNDNYMLTSVDVKDNMNNRYAFKLINMIENKITDDSIFKLTIPEGIRIIDLR